MSTFRINKKDGGYSCISNAPLQDKALTWKARGLLWYLLSKPNHWVVVLKDIENQTPEGKDAVRSGIATLLDAGYITREPVRQEGGKLAGWIYNVFESPVPKDQRTQKRKPRGTTAIRETRLAVNPLSGEPAPSKTEQEASTEEASKNPTVGKACGESSIQSNPDPDPPKPPAPPIPTHEKGIADAPGPILPPTGKDCAREGAKVWEAKFGKGSASYGRLGKALKPVAGAVGLHAMKEAFANYLKRTETQFASPENFKSKYLEYMPRKARPRPKPGEDWE